MSNALQLLMSSKSQIAMALPKHLDADRMVRIATTEFRSNPKLQQCEPMSFIGAVIQSSQLGLEVGSGLGQAYLVPYGNKATLIIGYQGLIELIYRSGKITSVNTFCVHVDDEFSYGFSIERGGMYLEWKPKEDIETPTVENTKLVVAFAKTKTGEIIYDVMTTKEIESIRAGSQGKNGKPWKDHWGEMAKKTAIRRLYKKLPKSVEMAEATKVVDSEYSGNFADYSEIAKNAIEPKKELELIEAVSDEIETVSEELL